MQKTSKQHHFEKKLQLRNPGNNTPKQKIIGHEAEILHH